MKITKQVIVSFTLLVIILSIYRVMPRPFGFAPQWAIAIFAGAIIKDRKFSFLLPLLSMFVSDALYEILYRTGAGNIPGFYSGQIVNYILFAAMTIFGFFITRISFKQIFAASIAAPTAFFLLSNFFVWLSNSPDAGWARPKTFNGLLLCYNDGLPFYQWSIAATLIFSAVIFGSYYFITKNSATAQERFVMA
ncbi:MAG TPA: DUF6580 family putative transport protein [Chitinophagaceae bacterium]|nr:DUF6580 family putative transport protein [Chitinophagaceae bacterium]